MATTYYQDIQKLYVAYFNRPADPAGLAYWETVVEAAKGDTTQVAATFAATDEYKATFAGMSNADIVNAVYVNLFGRQAEQAGKDYWADLLNNNKITIDKVVTTIAAGALGSDATSYANKVTAAAAFTAAVDTDAEKAGYSGTDANKVAKAFMSGITTDASLSAAITPAMLNASVAKVVAAGTPFTLTAALNALASANAAKASFLDIAADGKVGGAVATDASINDALDITKAGNKVAAVDALVTGDYSNSSTGVKAALLADQITANQAALTAANADAADAAKDIAAVSGLNGAITAKASADANVTATATTLLNAQADLAAKVAAYNTLHPTATISVAANGTVTGLITADANGNLKLASGITETTNAGITAVLASSTAELAAAANATAAVTADNAAIAQLNYLDMSTTEKSDLQAIAAGMHNVTLADGALPTLGQITTEQAILAAKATAAHDAAVASETTAGDYSTADSTKAAADTAAANAVTTFNALVTTYNGHAPQNDLVDAQVAAAAEVKTASDAIKALTDAVAALNAATSTKAQLDAVNGTIADAIATFTDNHLAAPVTLSTPGLSLIASADADIFVAGKADATIALFGLQGADSLYIGSQYTLNTTGDLTKGSDAAVEAFIIKDGANTKIVLEQKAFASSEATPGADLVTITLTGVDSTHVHLNNGIITIS